MKSIYTVGDVTNESDTYWYQLTPSAIDEVNTNNVVETSWYDVQGRKVSDNATGLLIKLMRMHDGTTKAIKVIR